MSVRRAINLFAGIVALAVLAGCGGDRAIIRDSRQLTQISIVPVSNPSEFWTRNDNFFLNILSGATAIGLAADNRDKSNRFADLMRDQQNSMGENMTRALIEELAKQGYEAEVLDGIERNPEDPESIDYSKLPATGAVLHVWYHDVGMYSSRWSADYLPRVNIAAVLTYPWDEDYLYDESIYYGADAKKGKYWAIPSDPAYRFRSFEALVNESGKVVESLDTGVREIARQLAREFRRVSN